jgi:ribosome modulation factor
MKTPYEAGSEAYLAGRPITECPYAFRTKEYASWRGGWTDASVMAHTRD